jgi:ABC-type enterobactin transport system permease subunit
MHTGARSAPNDKGETLLELMLAMAIMGIAVVAIVGGIATSILMSDIHRKQATAGAYVRNYAETVVAYVAAGTPASNANFLAGSSPDYSPSTVGFTAPAGGFVASVSSVWCWDDGSKKFISSCAAASAVQQVTLNIASSDSRVSETRLVIVRKP